MAAGSILRELKRRHVYRVAVVYALVAWLLLQLAAIALPAFGAPHWVLRALIGVFVILFPVALLLAWAFELTPEGVRRTEPAGSENARPPAETRRAGRQLDFAIIAVLVVAVGVLAWRLSVKRPMSPPRSTVTAVTPSTIPVKSIAVLPFVNNSGDPKQQYFSDGLSEDLIVALNQYPALTVIARESSFQLRNTDLDSQQIGEKLGVAHLLEGSVSHAGDEIRVRAELVDTATGRLLWSSYYDRPYKNLFALQDDITRAVATALKAQLLGEGATAVVQSDRPPSGSLDAYNAFLEGNFYFNPHSEKSFRRAIEYYEQAIREDPNYAAAYAQLSLAWSNLGSGYQSGTAMQQAYEKARSAADTALKLDPGSGAAHVARGYYLLWTFDYPGAEVEFQRALALAPAKAQAKSLLAFSLAAQGRLSKAVRLGREAVKADPLYARAFYNLATYLSGLGRSAAAGEVIRRAIALQPTQAQLHAWLAAIEVQRGDAKAALAAAEAETDPAFRTWALALAYAAGADKTRADAALHDLTSQYGDLAAFNIAEVYAYREEPDQAFVWLDRAWHQRDPAIAYLLFDPFLLRYRDDPRFAAFCRKVGLPVPGSAPSSAASTASTPSHFRKPGLLLGRS